MKNKPLVSVLMTSYNREKYIAEAIESVLASTYQEWELIILDDCSKDNTLKIAEEWAKKDARIKVYKNEHNLGQFRNRNRIVQYASGHYLKYLDSDDLLYPYGLELIVHYMEEYPEAGYGLFSLKPDPNRPYPYLLDPYHAYKRYYIEGSEIFNRAPLSSIIRKEAFLAAGGFPHEAVSGDFAMWHQMSLHHSLLLIPATAVWYRTHEEQEMQKVRNDFVQEYEYMKVAAHYLQLPDCPLETEDVQGILSKLRKTQKRFILSKTLRKGVGVGLQLSNFAKAPFSLKPPGH